MFRTHTTLVFSLLLGQLAAQSLYAPSPQRAGPFGALVGTTTPVPGDFDNDGLLDLAIGSTTKLSIFFQRERRFVELAIPHAQAQPRLLAADANRDGNLDLLHFGAAGPLWYLNDGAGTFTPTAKGLIASLLGTELVCVDLFGDARPELATLDTTGIRVLSQGASGIYADATPAELPPGFQEHLVSADFDGDGRNDLGVSGPQGTWFLANLQKGWTRSRIATDRILRSRIADLDRDGRPEWLTGTSAGDLVALEYSASGWSRTQIWKGRQNQVRALLAADFDGDQDVDLLIGGASDGGAEAVLQDGTGRFTAAPRGFLTLPFDPSATEAEACAGDFDGDGDQDLVYVARRANAVPRLHLREGASYVESTGDVVARLDSGVPAHASGFSGTPEAADLDGDGLPELVYPGGGILRFDATGRATRSHVLGKASPAFMGVAVLDLDRDGDLDVVGFEVVVGAVTAHCLRNDGRGAFQMGSVTTLTGTSTAPARCLVGDLDRDGAKDLVVLQGPGSHVVLRSSGRGDLQQVVGAIPAVAESTYDGTLADCDGDGDLDLVLANASVQGRARSRLLHYQAGAFHDMTAALLPPLVGAPELSLSVAAADFDGDGHQDLAFLGGTVTGVTSSRWLRGSASGAFTMVASLPEAVSQTMRSLAADLDGDGDLDLIAPSSVAGGPTVIENRAGTLVANPGLVSMPHAGPSGPVAVLDADADGDLDLVVEVPGLLATRDAVILAGRMRQIGAATTPRVGERWDLLVEASPGRATRPSLAMPVFGTRLAEVALPPLGTLRVDPASVIVLPPLTLHVPAGAATLGVQVPANLALVGAPFVVQCLVVDLVAGARFTNVLAERLR